MSPALTVRGPFRGVTGHDRHVRAFVRHLVAERVAVELVDVPEWSPLLLPESARGPWFEALGRPVPAHAVLHFCMPHQVAPVSGRLNVNFTMFEASRAPAAWVVENRRHALVVVPTASSRDAWLARGFPAERIRLCPLGIDGAEFRPGLPPLGIADPRLGDLVSRRVRFLSVSEPGPRKNLFALVRVWLRATAATDDAALIVKLSFPSPASLVRFARDLAEVEAAVGKTRHQAAPMLFLHRLLPDAEMPALFATATHYWSMSHGEGWDQPMCEAAASGLQLIAPRHSAYTAYLDDTVAWMLPAVREPAVFGDDPGLQALFASADWWTPDEDAAAERIVRLIRHPGDRKLPARARIVERFAWPVVTRQPLAILRELHAAHGREF